MATFIENLRESVKDPFAVARSLKDYNLQQRWKNADFEGFEKALDSGEIKTPKSQQEEFDTVKTMDSIYTDLSNKFQNYFYNKYRDVSAIDEVPDETIEKESKDFLKNEIENTELGDYVFENGKNFIENFRKYGYDENLLPNPDLVRSSTNKKGIQPYHTQDGNLITGRRLDVIFPFKVTTPQIRNDKKPQIGIL